MLYNLATKAIMPDKVKFDLCGQSDIETCLFEELVNEPIKLNKINLWVPVKKRSLQTWKSTTKRIKLKVDQKVVELKEDRNLVACLLLVAKSKSNINLEHAVGDHELSVVPRSLFSDDGQMLPCGGKSCLMSKLEGLIRASPVSSENQEGNLDNVNQSENVTNYHVALVDGMAELKSLSKPENVKTCLQLADHFCSHVWEKFGMMDEVHMNCIVFDRYDFPNSLKEATRIHRPFMQTPVENHVTDTTNIAKISMTKLLSHPKTKH